MSFVTNAILSISTNGSDDDCEEDDKLAQVNMFLELTHHKGFVSVECRSLPPHWYGGSKALEVFIAIGAFNYLHIDELVDHIRSLEWHDPTCVQLIYSREDEGKFKVTDVVGHGYVF